MPSGSGHADRVLHGTDGGTMGLGRPTTPTATAATDRRPSTPGEILREEFLEPLGISNYRLAKTIGVSETAVGEIVRGRRSISTAMAYRLAAALGTTPEFWMNLQRDYGLLTFDPTTIGDIRPLVEA